MTPRVEVISGRPYVSFREQYLSSRGSVRAFDAATGAWEAVGMPGACSDREDWWSRLALGANGILYRASYEYGLNPDGGAGLNLRRYAPSSGAWLRVGELPLGTGEVHTPDLAVAPDGSLLVAFRDGPGGNLVSEPQGAVSVLRVDPETGQASFVGGPGFSNDLVFAPSSSSWNTNIEVGPNGDLWVAWSERSISDQLVGRSLAAVARCDPGLGEWELVGDFGLGHNAFGEHISLALDARGRPFVATFVPDWVAGAGAVRVYTTEPTSDGVPRTWTPVGDIFGAEDEVEFSPDAGYREYLAFAIAPDGTPYVAYRSRVHVRRLCVRRFDGLFWERVGAPGFTPPDGEDDYPTLAFLGPTPLVAFRHGCSELSNCGVIEDSALLVWAYH